MGAAAPPPAATLTLAEAAAYLDPPVTREQLAALVGALPGLRPAGTRRRGRGKPAVVYDAADLLELHAAVARWLRG